MNNEEKSVDISGRKVVAMRDVQEAAAAGASRILISENSIVTPAARDFLQQKKITIVANGNASGGGDNSAWPSPNRKFPPYLWCSADRVCRRCR